MIGRVVWVTGAGSGIGRASAVSAAARGDAVALSGRRVERLRDTAALVEAAGGTALVLPLDSTEASEVAATHRSLVDAWGDVTDLVLSAGLNTPRRAWADQSMAEFQQVVATNLTGVAGHIDAVLPGMRRRGDGVIVVVSSFSAWRFSPGAGVAYGASKSGLATLTQTLNGEEGSNGIRACHLCPGDVATDFLAQRPVVPGDDQRRSMLTPSDVADAVRFVLDAPPHVRIDELVVSPSGRRVG